MATINQAAPETFAEVAEILAGASAEQRTVRIRGAGTKSGWGRPTGAASIELGTGALNEILEHNAGDHTAVLEAGVPLAEAQRLFAQAGQRVALDPPLGPGNAATIGGIMATADSGPLRHRFGAPRDLVLGVTVALSDGAIATSGSKVIKNVAGYDLAKLFAGAYGTLGVILSVSLRLHPLPEAGTTALGATSDPDALAAAAVALARAPLEFEALDVAWHRGRGGLLARCAGPEHARRGRRAAKLLHELGLTDVDITEDDEMLWERQRAGQRSRDGVVVRIAHAPSALADVVRAADAAQATLVGRAALGTSFVEMAADDVVEMRTAVAPAITVVLDAPAALRARADPWASPEAPALELMRSIKRRFDPTGTCNPGLFVGGI
ncbi:MAG: glycolate oxidase binding subunit [Solirubrobacteraceae bacterium]|jgi:glycolate oxidase FAD binding subunit|nr:glycolate oxidase binding subunit [Solirubrobacteraceae bacterium]